MSIKLEDLTKTQSKILPPYKVIVHNDDINTFDHVIEVLMKVFGYEYEDSKRMTFEVHNKGLSIVKGGVAKEHAEFYVEQLISYSLTATYEED